MKVVSPTAEGIAEAVVALRKGEGVLYPTETLYGLGFDPFSEAALNKLCNASTNTIQGRGRGRRMSSDRRANIGMRFFLNRRRSL